MLDTMPLASDPFAAARLNMVDSQLRPNRVRDERLLGAMGALPREAFVPEALRSIAYCDEDLEVAPGRSLLEPMIMGRLLQEAMIAPSDRVLDIAAATGYSSAVLSAMAKDVVAVESEPELAKTLLHNVRDLGLTNVTVTQGPLTAGYSLSAPYNVILINGGVEFVPDQLAAQLVDGGRLMALVRLAGAAAAVYEARLYQKLHGGLSHRALFNATPKLLREFTLPPSFVF
jgi:protein-L-isoaspartate(D-aspartate) O-methyltransferase